MSQQLKNNAVRTFHLSYPTYPEPSTIEIVECESPSGKKHQAVALSEEHGLLAAYGVRPCGRLEEAVSHPMKSAIPGQPGRLRPQLIGLPPYPRFQAAMLFIWDPRRIETVVKWGEALAERAAEDIDFYTRHLRDLNRYQEDLCSQQNHATDGSEQDKQHRQRVASQLREVHRCIETANANLDKAQSVPDRVKSENRQLVLRAFLLGNPDKIDALKARFSEETLISLDQNLGMPFTYHNLRKQLGALNQELLPSNQG